MMNLTECSSNNLLKISVSFQGTPKLFLSTFLDSLYLNLQIQINCHSNFLLHKTNQMGLNQSTQNHENKPQQHQQVSLPQNSKYKYSQQRNQLNSNSASRMKKQDKPDKVNESEIKKNSSSKISDSKIAEGKSQAKMLKVMTLNYSGILLSPFQFYPQAFAKDYNKLSLIFQKLLKKMLDEEGFVYKDPVAKDVKKQFKWSVGTIDKDVQQNRYTPIYNKRVGIRTTKQNQAQKNHHNHHHDHQYEDAPICDCFSHKHHHKQLVQQQQQHQQKRLEAFQQFKQSWQRTFQPHAGKYQKKHIDDMMKFDLLCYKTILRYVYKDQVTKVMSKKEKQPLTFELTDKFIKGLDASLYESFMEEFFNKAFIDDEIKIKKTIKKFFQLQVDVIYLQQTTKAFKQRIKSKQFSDVYYVQECKTGQSLMLVNHRKIAPQLTYQQFKSKIRMLQNVAWNGDSVGIAYEDILFICAHLSSKQEKNTAQKIQMLQRLQQLVQQFKGSTVILGGDINSFIQKVPPGFYIYPERKQERTTKKKRTFLQPQVNKANKDIIQCKDHIISNKPLRRKVVWTIDCQMPGQNMFLPTDDHPYDHFALFAEVQYK